MKTFLTLLLLVAVIKFPVSAQQINPTVTISNGTLEGRFNPQTKTNSFKGIPFAKPPVGDLRWREPQPADNWTGVRRADHFSHRPMQKPIFSDMIFRADTMSEDCLYLNVWAPANAEKNKLPVLVYFYGGGFVGGDGSESRYDGESMAQKGIVTITISYRLGIFGFFSHPELTKESPNHASGDYGLLDQNAALRWVQANIKAFGGDPKRVTIAGESAGSIAVSAQMASPLSKNLIAGAIGESGAMIKPTIPPSTLAESEKNGTDFAAKQGVKSLADLRAIPAIQLLDFAAKPGAWKFSVTVDGYFLPASVVKIFEEGKQAHVPLLVGWNSTEIPYQSLTGTEMPTPENYAAKVKQQFGENAEEILKLYPGTTQNEVIRSATALASDRFIAFSTWKWADLASRTGEKPVYRYVFAQPRPKTMDQITAEGTSKMPAALVGASHASEIEFAMGNLVYNTVFPWTTQDYKVSAIMEDYFANFIKTGDPNGAGLPRWTPNTKGSAVGFMHIDANTHIEKESERARYLFLDKLYEK